MDQNSSSNFIKDILLTIVAPIVLSLYNFMTNHPQLGILFIFITVITGLIFAHCKKIFIVNKFTEKTENRYKYPEKIRKWAGILIIGLLSITTFVQFFPITNQVIQSVLWPTVSPTITLSPTLTQTIIPTFSSIIPTVLENSITSTITPTQTKSEGMMDKDIIQGCLTEAWKEWPSSIDYGKSYTGDCIEYPLGKMSKHDGKILISNDPKENLIFGITESLPDNDVDIQIKFSISELATNNIENNAELYFGFADSNKRGAPQKPTGEFVIFRAYQKETPPTLIFGEYPDSKIARQTLRNEVDLGGDFTIIFHKDKLSFDVLIIGAGEPIEKTNIQLNPNWDSFFIGYIIPSQSNLVATITDVQFIDK